jgi:Reverse transcriptase (RNA-dependent DNA polymerase)
VARCGERIFLAVNQVKKITEDLSLLEKFANVRVAFKAKNMHTFGCPMYVLDSQLQVGNSIPKWQTQARLAIKLGNSLNHATNVGLALNLTTGLVSAVFHAKFDETFATVSNSYGQYVPKSQWQVKCGFRKASEVTAPEQQVKEGATTANESSTSVPNTDAANEFNDIGENLFLQPSTADNENHANSEGVETTDQLPRSVAPNTSNATSQDAQSSTNKPPIRTRYGRTVKRPVHLKDYVSFETDIIDDTSYDFTKNVDPVALMTATGQDNLYFHEILREPDKKQFIMAMKDNRNWITIKRKDLPKDVKVIPSVWAMRRKRKLTDGSITKWKARLNVNGSKQVYGTNYWETYAPVAQWISIRLVLCLASLNSWTTKTFDFVQAFPQAPSETKLYIDVPKGCHVEGNRDDWALKVVNNIYGQKQAGRFLYKYLTNKLINELHFQQSKYDPCVLWRDGCLLVVYTDDTIITGPSSKAIVKIIEEIGKLFNIPHEDQVDDFLCVNIGRNTDGTVTFTQPKLIQEILDDLGLKDNSVTKPTPAISSTILQPDEGEEEFNETWNYRSLIGKINYLEKSTRPDIAYAVHQCARFAANPKASYGKAVKNIGRYLLGTKTKGITCKLNNQAIQCYADADFAGNWETQIAAKDRATARSRSGYVIKYAGMPIVWASKLQTEIALSATEAEYISLSTSLREVLPMINFLEELKLNGFNFTTDNHRIYCTVFEDNEGALEMAKTPRFRPRTKHINIKYHHFHEAVEKGINNIVKIDTLDQQADILTKPLNDAKVTKLRRLIMGW